LTHIYTFGKITLGQVQFGTNGFETVLYRGHGYNVAKKRERDKITKQCIGQSDISRFKMRQRYGKKRLSWQLGRLLTRLQNRS
jgi:hypothetical protein